VVVNRGSGSVGDGEVDLLVDEGAGVLGMAGGDGSVGCAAGVAADADRVLWALPGGTLNHFARELGHDTVEEALASLESGWVADVDLGDAGGVAFVNNASIGVYGEIVRRRERLQRTLPKRVALLVTAARTLRRAEPLALEIDGVPVSAYLVFVGNGPYSGTGLTGRESLQEGVLDVRVLPAEGRFPRLSALGAILLSPRRRSRWLRQTLRDAVAIRLARAAPLAHDGEVLEVSGEITFRTRPGALRVVVPPPA
jgi:diacylglycerol kinase family enzyme